MLGAAWGRGWGEREGVEEEAELEGFWGRGVSLMMGGVLLWADLVSVACMGVMKLDWTWDGWGRRGA